MKRIILTLALILTIKSFPQITNDIIQPIRISTGETKSFPISDLFYSKNYYLSLLPNKDLITKYDSTTKTLKIKVSRNSSSFTVLKIKGNNDTLSVPVKVTRKYPVTFKFPARKNYKWISVFGSFNDWNRKQFPLKRYDNYYKTTVYLRPGNYQYKFFADSIEYCDPNNPDSVSNGMGGFNSVLTINEKQKDKLFLHKLKFYRSKKYSVFSFYLEAQNPETISQNNIFAFLDNHLINKQKIEINGNVIKLNIPNKKLNTARILRIVASLGNTTSNIQNVFLENGQPVGKSNLFNWHRAIIYSLIIDRFYDGDKSNSIPLVHDSLFAKANYNGGDFQGIIDKLQEGYFDSLGINVLWISPVYDNPSKPYREYPPPHRWFAGYHGYWPVNSFNTDEHFGSLQLLKTLVEIAHKHKINVLLDFVSNHVHIENPLYKKHRDWFGSLYLPDGRKNIRFWDEYRLTTWFEPYLPSFDYINSDEAVEFMTDNAIWWLEKTGADGFRHDAVKHVPNRFWRRLTEKLKERGFGNKFQIGETFGSDVLISSYVNNGQLNSQFNFNLYDASVKTILDTNKSFENIVRELHTTFDFYGENNLMGNIMDSHDKIRFMAYADGDLTFDQSNASEIGWKNPPEVDKVSSYKKAEFYYAYMFAIPGIPVIYYGSEFGMTGAADPDNRRIMRFGQGLSKAEKSMLSVTSRIVKLRKEHSALSFGDFYILHSDKNTFAFLRSDFNERILVVLNKNFTNPKTITLEFPKLIRANRINGLTNNSKIEVKNNSVKITLPALGWEYFILSE